MAFGAQPVDSNNIPISSTYNPVTALFKAMRGVNKSTDASSNDSVALAVSTEDGYKATYAAAIVGLVPITTAPTDIFTLTGSSTKTIRVTRISIYSSVTLATTAILPVALLKRSTANTSGTSSSPTKVACDSTSPAVSATVLAYTVPPTTGTLVGVIRNYRSMMQFTSYTATDFPPSTPYIEDFGIRPSQCPVLRGTGEVFAVNLNSIPVVSGWAFDISVEWTEE